MKRFLIEGQQQAQLQVAEGITTVLSREPVLVENLRVDATGAEKIGLYMSEANHLVDGYGDEWRSLMPFRQSFGDVGEAGFDMILAQRGTSVFGWLSVVDDSPRLYRPGSNSLKNTDHIRLHFESGDGQIFTVVLLFEGNGKANAYRVDPAKNKVQLTFPERQFRAEVLLQPEGYDLELGFPASLITESRRFGVTLVNAQLQDKASIITSTFDNEGRVKINPVSMRSDMLEGLLSEFAEDNTRLWIIDADRQVKALVGQLQPPLSTQYLEQAGTEQAGPWWRSAFHWITGVIVGISPGPFEDFDAATVLSRNDGIYRQALATGFPVVASRNSLDGRADIITAAVPLGDPQAPYAVLLQEKSTQNILLLQRQSLEKLMLMTIAAMALVTMSLLLFAIWLTLRIRRLGVDVSAAVDSYGRLKTQKLIKVRARGDEIDDVAARINGMLSRLEQYQSFLKTIPRVLRHEINNPLNTIATSLDRLGNSCQQKVGVETYVESANRGLERINHVINRVTEAASLEQAMQEGDKEPVDLTELISTYLGHQYRQSSIEINLVKPVEPVVIMACGDYLALLLDKLLDNARDHCHDYIRDRCQDHSRDCSGYGAPITVTLAKEEGFAVLAIENKGPLIAESDLPNLFNFMFSQRQDTKQHLGLGLYIVQLITEFHGGVIVASNLADGSGVCFTLKISLYEAG